MKRKQHGRYNNHRFVEDDYKNKPTLSTKSGLTMCDYLLVSCTAIECCIVEVDYKHKLITNNSLLAYAN